MQKILIYTICSILFLSSCIDEEPRPDCEPITQTMKDEYNHIFPDTGISAPCFNPENPNEIIYREHIYTTGEFWLCKYNIATKKKSYILKAEFNSEPKWGKNDWIVFSLNDYNLYRIKSTGEELKQLTFDNKTYHPSWTFNDSLIVYSSYVIIPNPADTNRLIHLAIGVISDINGVSIDTITGWSRNSVFCSDTIMFSVSHNGMGTINTNIGEHIMYKELKDDEGGSFGIEKLNANTVYWSNFDGIYSTNIFSGESRVIKATCNSSFYGFPTYSSETNMIIWQHDIRIVKDSSIIYNTNFEISKLGSDSIKVLISSSS